MTGSPSRPRLARTAGLVGSLTMLSRISGLVREQLLGALLGTTFWGDAYQIAFRIPNLLRDLFGEGALSTSLVPVFARTRTEEGRPAAQAVANKVLGTLLVLLAVFVALGVLFAPEIVGVLGRGFGPEKAAATVVLTRVMMPFLVLVSVGAVVMGILNAESRFAAPASASTMFNLLAIAVGAALWLSGADVATTALGWSLGVLLGGLGQIAVQLPSLRGTGFRFRPRLDLRLRDPRVRAVGLLVLPATLGVAATNLNVFVSSYYASHIQGATTWLAFAFRLIHLPIGVFGVAIGTVSATNLSNRAAAGDLDGMRRDLAQAVRLLGILTIPSTVGLVALDGPIIQLIYQYGRFKASDTVATAGALSCYAAGLFAYAAIKVYAPAFYALGETRVPMAASLASMTANVTACVVLFPLLGHRGLALATAAAAIANLLVLALVFRARHGGLGHLGVGSTLLRACAASAGMGAAAFGVHRALAGALGPGVTGRAAEVFVPMAVAAPVYLGLLHLLRVEEAAQLTALLGRLRRRFSRAPRQQ